MMKASLIVVLIVQKPLSVPNPGLDIFLQRIRQERMSNECLELEMITDEEDYVRAWTLPLEIVWRIHNAKCCQS